MTFVRLIVVGVMSALAGELGARAAGLRESGLGLQFIVVWLYGFVGGLLVHFMAPLVVRQSGSDGRQSFTSLLLTSRLRGPIVVFVAWFIVCFAERHIFS